MRRIMFAPFLFVISTMSGCNIWHENHLLGTWKLVRLTSVPGNYLGEVAAENLAPKMIGEKFKFTNHEVHITNPANGYSVNMKVIKYEIKDGGKKVIVVQDQEKSGLMIREDQPAQFSDGYKNVKLTSGLIILHFARD